MSQSENMPLKIASWNINSVRLRMPLVKRLTEEERPDILCLQETKVRDELFPLDDLRQMGYCDIRFRGEKGYNGVAIASRIPLKGEHWHTDLIRPQTRHLAVTLPDGTHLHNFYIPAGGDIPDPEANPHFRHKLDFVDAMHDWYAGQYTANEKIIMVGDLNIAPREHDVWSHKQMLRIISHTPMETERFTRLYEGLGWVDTARHFVADTDKLYSWWSYRAHDWEASDRGRRLDHIWCTLPLRDALATHKVLKTARGWEQPSDHVPIITEFTLEAA